MNVIAATGLVFSLVTPTAEAHELDQPHEHLDASTIVITRSSEPQPEQSELVRALERQTRELEALRSELESQRSELEGLRRPRLQDTGPPLSDGERASFGDKVVIGEDEVVQDAVAFGEDVVVRGKVRGDATSFGGNVRIKPGAVVLGDAVSFGGRVVVEEGGQVRGARVTMAQDATRSVDDASEEDEGSSFGKVLTALYHRLVLLLSFAGAGVLLVGLFPDRVGRVAVALEEQPVRSTVLGLASTVALSFGALLFAVTVLGIPVSFVIMSLLGLAWLLGFVGLCQAVGDRLPLQEKVHGRWLAFLGGTLLVTFVSALPFIGVMVVVLTSLAGVGAAFATRFGGR